MDIESLEEILYNLNDGIYIVDKTRKIKFWNKSAKEQTGYTSSDVVGKHCYDNILQHVDIHGNNLCENGCPLTATMEDGKIKEALVFLNHKDGHCIPIRLKGVPLKNENGEIVGAIEIFSGDSELKNIFKKIKDLEKLTMLDDLTQIPNRRYLTNIIHLKLEDYLMNKRTFGLIFIDIDHFKRFNDCHGHDVGDLILKTITKTFSNNLREDDVIGRWGGEEFIGVFSEIDEENLKKVAEKLRSLVEKTSIKVDDKNLRVTISAGVTLIDPKDNVDALIKRADRLLYESKKNGRNRVTVG